MGTHDIDLDPVEYITFDAIGQPGQRVFYLQARDPNRTITLLMEKVQIQTMSMGYEHFMAEVYERYPDLPEVSGEYDEATMHIAAPVDPLFRAGEIGLSYDAEHDQVVLIVREIVTDQEKTEEATSVRFWCSRTQLLVLSSWGMEVTRRGRPICPYCGQPMDPEGHFCPKKNGRHPKTSE